MTSKLRTMVLGASLACPGLLLAADPPTTAYRLRVDNCATIPKGAQPAPPGTYVNGFIKVEDTLAEADDFVIYKHMWYRAGKDLGPLGRYQLDLIAKRLPNVPFPVVVATSKNDELDEARREIIVNLLAMRGFTDPTRVIVAYPVAEGLYGEEADQITSRFLRGASSSFGSIGGVAGVPGFSSGFPGLFGFSR